MQVQGFTFSPFQENTYVLFDESKECVIVDPGCYDQAEKDQLEDFIRNNGLTPVRLLNTHCHLDHVFGNKFVCDTYNLKPEFHEGELPVLRAVYGYSISSFGLAVEESPEPKQFLPASGNITFGNTTLEIRFVPGHSPASLCFINHEHKIVIAGDTLFLNSIGRTDLPGGNHATLLNSIKTQLFTLGDDYKVFAGHMAPTYIGYEKKTNPFLKADS